MDIYLGKSVDTFNTISEFSFDSCLAFFDNWLKPISGVAGIYTTNYHTGKGSYFYGNTNCGGDKMLGYNDFKQYSKYVQIMSR